MQTFIAKVFDGIQSSFLIIFLHELLCQTMYANKRFKWAKQKLVNS